MVGAINRPGRIPQTIDWNYLWTPCHPGGIQGPHKNHQGDTQEHPGGTQETRHSLEAEYLISCFLGAEVMVRVIARAWQRRAHHCLPRLRARFVDHRGENLHTIYS